VDKFNFKKKFGQNFLKDENILNKIINVSEIKDNSLIIEVGPGNGALTSKLIETGNTVLSYEIDSDLESILLDRFKDKDNFNLIMGDFLDRNIKEDIKDFKYKSIYLVANLPYYITTPIISKVIDEIDVDKMVIMVQKEVGDRLSSKVGSRDYSSLTVFLNYYFDIKKEFIVGKNCFVPSPNVDSAIVSLTKKENRLFVKDMNLFERLVRDSFQFKRKNLRNNLKGYNLEKIEDVLRRYGFDLTSRGEVIPLEVFVEISNNL